MIATLHLDPYIIKTGFVDNEQLTILYSLATALLLPSHYEGFGLPVLEAMACGCPVVVSDISSLTEISGPSIRVLSKDIQSIASGILSVLTMSKAKRNQVRDAGYTWASQYTWEKVAKETVLSYKKALQ